jgi:hypothetical protein
MLVGACRERRPWTNHLIPYLCQNIKMSEMRNIEAFRAPLNPQDTETQTFGCRLSNPDACAKNSIPGVCAFASADNICHSPPVSWSKRFQKLKVGAEVQ